MRASEPVPMVKAPPFAAPTRVVARVPATIVATFLAVVAVLVGARTVSADQNIVYDDAGSAAHISLVGDSTLAGVRWYADYGALERYNFVLSAESCRRTIELSCISREGYRSENVLAAMQTLDGELGEIVVIMSGYNDPIFTIDEAIEGVVAEARQQGAEHVVWLSLRAGDDVDYSDPQEQSSVATFQAYNEQLVAAAEASDGYLQIADWATYSLGASSWFEYDGVHLTTDGVDAVTTYIASVVDQVLAGEDISPAEAPWAVLVPGAEGDTVQAVQQAVIDAGVEVPGGADGVYGNDTMIAVAEYQRQTDGLQETGAVDLATAQALGVFSDPDEADSESAEADGETTAEAPMDEAPPAVPIAAADLEPEREVAEADTGAFNFWLNAGALIAFLAAAVVLRRRHVVARRNTRRAQRNEAFDSTCDGSTDSELSRR